MNILVCIKQVPNTRHMTIDPETNRLVRHGVSAMINPADRNALEEALRLRERYGGAVTVMSMGAPQAEEVLVSAHLVGADRCILLTDAAFAGSDTFATASVLAAAVKYEQQRTGERFDMIFCGKNTIDGETAQVGPELAELLGIPGFTGMSRLDFNGVSCEIEYVQDDVRLNVCAALPVLAAYPLSGDVCLRAALPDRLESVETVKIPRLGMEELSPWLNREELGLNGSATRVVRSYVPSTRRESVRFDRGSARYRAERLVEALVRDGRLGSKGGGQKAAVRTEASVKERSGRICVFVEQSRSGACRNVGVELLSAAAGIADAAGLKVSAILAGADNKAAIAELSTYPVDEILSCEDAVFADMQLHDYVEAVSEAVERFAPEGLLMGGTELGKALAARIAGRFRTGLTAECSGVRYDAELGCIVWSRPAYGGKLMADIVCRSRRPQMGTVREGVYVRPETCEGRPEVIRLEKKPSALSDRIAVLRKAVLPGFAPRGGETAMIVGMGRGVRDMDGFDLCCDFADAIGADIGASRGATDMRLVSQQYLIGSNGRTVRPGIYFACGISGSLQHMMGVLDAGCIVAINRDPNAEIHQYADYSVIGDLFEILPQLESLMQAYL